MNDLTIHVNPYYLVIAVCVSVFLGDIAATCFKFLLIKVKAVLS